MIPIGTPVKSTTNGFEGIVKEIRGGPGGDHWHKVQTLSALPRARWFVESELEEIADPVDTPYATGSEIYCFGQNCQVIGFNEDSGTYDLLGQAALPSGDVFFRHWYRNVPAFEVWLWHENREDGLRQGVPHWPVL
ncbi:hypothetical protein RFN29_25775 [Mesorhizobium sp. VK22B]|uniref:Uncharacterized protein n=1 Tax=Mesorhizobium captivum TaxID=3072319 RepID=A0ABU4Z6R7_9HYPH|nr:hypothetical protein [Mesorhizobium sp. VK22B]MDX8494972.1 hypothetical protein [Mesorhizobium sp. VK22B]